MLLEAGGKAEDKAALRKNSKAEGTDIYFAFERKEPYDAGERLPLSLSLSKLVHKYVRLDGNRNLNKV